MVRQIRWNLNLRRIMLEKMSRAPVVKLYYEYHVFSQRYMIVNLESWNWLSLRVVMFGDQTLTLKFK